MSGEWRKTNAKEAARADQCASVYPFPNLCAALSGARGIAQDIPAAFSCQPLSLTADIFKLC
jgi:hypothetical protein